MRLGSPRSAYPGEPRPGRPRCERLLAASRRRGPGAASAQWLEPTRHPRCLPNPEPSSGFQPARSVAARELPALPCGAAGAGPASSAGTRGWPGMNESARSTRLDRSQGAGRPLLQLLAWPGPALNSGSHLRAGRPVWSPVLCAEHAGETLWGEARLSLGTGVEIQTWGRCIQVLYLE